MRGFRPGPGEVRLWWIEPGTPAPGPLAPDEEARARAMAEPRARAAYALRRGALRLLLGHCLDLPPERVPLATERGGRPVLAAPVLAAPVLAAPVLAAPGGAAPLTFSVSQATGAWAVIALAPGGPLGVDVETHGQPGERGEHGQHLDIAGLARRFLPDLDLDAVRPEERPPVFWRAWTRYEATLKAAGATLGQRPGPQAAHWTVTRPPAPRGHTVALVTARPPTTVTTRLFRAPTACAATPEGLFDDHATPEHPGPQRHR
ncbi:4'-phosphopantetheinyl transferase superfamily protein [Streptomyces sp. PmtG]